jgi:hypothetical protein
MKNFLILCLESRADGLFLWWRPNRSGYTTCFDDAGRYTEAEVKADPLYYNNGDETLAIPEVMAMAGTVRVVPYQSSVLKLFKEYATKAHEGG